MPWTLPSWPARSSACACEDTSPAALSSAAVRRSSEASAASWPLALSTRSARTVSAPASTPSGCVAPLTRVLRLSSAAALRSSAASACSRPPRLVTVPRAVTERFLAAMTPPWLSRVFADKVADSPAAIVPSRVSSLPCSVASSVVAAVSLPPPKARSRAAISAALPCNTALPASMSSVAVNARRWPAETVPEDRFSVPPVSVTSLPAAARPLLRNCVAPKVRLPSPSSSPATPTPARMRPVFVSGPLTALASRLPVARTVPVLSRLLPAFSVAVLPADRMPSFFNVAPASAVTLPPACALAVLASVKPRSPCRKRSPLNAAVVPASMRSRCARSATLPSADRMPSADKVPPAVARSVPAAWVRDACVVVMSPCALAVRSPPSATVRPANCMPLPACSAAWRPANACPALLRPAPAVADRSRPASSSAVEARLKTPSRAVSDTSLAALTAPCTVNPPVPDSVRLLPADSVPPKTASPPWARASRLPAACVRVPAAVTRPPCAVMDRSPPSATVAPVSCSGAPATSVTWRSPCAWPANVSLCPDCKARSRDAHRPPACATANAPPAVNVRSWPACSAPRTLASRPACKASVPPAVRRPSAARSRAAFTLAVVPACNAAVDAKRTSPLALTSSAPVSAARLPPTFTPTPASVPTRRMLLAYMPPRAAKSMATPGAAPCPACACTAPVL
ncbi:Minus agglutinin [plant metagenome]